jgi:hypothetical protein
MSNSLVHISSKQREHHPGLRRHSGVCRSQLAWRSFKRRGLQQRRHASGTVLAIIDTTTRPGTFTYNVPVASLTVVTAGDEPADISVIHD